MRRIRHAVLATVMLVGGLFAMGGATAGLQFVSQQAASASITCPSGWNTYSNYEFAELNHDAPLSTQGTTYPHPVHDINGFTPDTFTFCSHTTLVCSPQCSQGDAYFYDNNQSAYIDGASNTYSDTWVAADQSQGSATEFTWQCTGDGSFPGNFDVQNVLTGGAVQDFASRSGYSHVLGTPSTEQGTYDILFNASGGGFCY